MGGRGIRRVGAVLAMVLAGLCLSAGKAVAGQFEIVTCQGAPPPRYSTDAFQGATKNSRMKVVRACDPAGPEPHGLITGNKQRPGKNLADGDVALAVLNAPPGTVITRVSWEGVVKAADCRMKLQVYAEVPRSPEHPDGTLTIKNGQKACNPAPGRTRPTYAVDSFNAAKDLPGASRIVQRAICAAGKGRHCSASKSNYVRTTLATVRVLDNAGPTGAIVQDTPLTRGDWVSGDQALNYEASDNVGVRVAQASVQGVPAGRDDNRSCDSTGVEGTYLRQVPCENGPGQILVHTQQAPEGTHTLELEPVDAAGNAPSSGPSIAVRVDNTPPSRVDVGLEGGQEWRNSSDFAAVWSNPVETDRAPIVSMHFKLCPAAGGDCREGDQAAADIHRLAMPTPAPGEWTLSMFRRDAAGNGNPAYSSVPVTLRYDPDPPQMAFEPSSTTDPTRIVVPTTDALSGLAGGSIEIAREDSGIWQGLVTERDGDRLVARVDDASLPAGRYLMRARVTDRAGNEGVTDRRVDGEPMILTLPLRVAARMEAAFEVERGGRNPVTEMRPTIRARFGRRVRVAGRLVAPDGSGIPGEQVQVLARNDAALEHPIDVIQTGLDGRFEYLTTADSSRTFRFLHAATPTVLPANAEVTVIVPAATTAHARPRNLRNGHAVRFSGRLRGLPAPPSGKLIELQVRFPTGWQTFRTIRTHADGRWSARYRFARTRGVVRYRFRARLPREAGYPFDTGVSKSVIVRVRGAR